MKRKDLMLHMARTLVRRRVALRRTLEGHASMIAVNDRFVGDSVDAAADCEQDELDSQLAAVESRELAAMDAALDRIRDGYFGICEACEKPIPTARLQALPYATLCIIIVLHVLDEALIETIAAHEFGSPEEVAKRMRQHAEQKLAEYKSSAGDVEIDAIVSEGLPFLEIIRKADDFAVDAIVTGRVGTRGHFEKLLFGSTAEKVLRGARHPVIVLPQSDRD